jgi:hypothetical protein
MLSARFREGIGTKFKSRRREYCGLFGLGLCRAAMAGESCLCVDPVLLSEPNIRLLVEPRIGVFVLGPLNGNVIRVKHVGCATHDLRETLLSLVPPSASELYVVWSYCDTVEIAETLQELLQSKYLKRSSDSRERRVDDASPPSSQ